MMQNFEVIIPFISFNIFTLFVFKILKNKFNIIVYPSRTTVHKKKSFPIGGIYFLFIYLASSIYLFILDPILSKIILDNSLKYFLISLLLIGTFLIGYMDDKFKLSPLKRIFLLFLLFYVFLYFNSNFIINKIIFLNFDLLILLKEFSIFFTILSLILLIQILNFFDGIDLQLCIYYIIIFLYLYFLTKFIFLLYLLVTLFLFLFLNKKEKIFLGDSGVYFLSTILGIIMIHFYNERLIIAENIFVILIIPFTDFIRLFFKRLFNKKNPMTGDLNHIHHILLNRFSFLKTLIIIIHLYAVPIILFFSFPNFFLEIIAIAIILYLFIVGSKNFN